MFRPAFCWKLHRKIPIRIEVHLLIIILFQEDNIFGTNASLTYGPQIQRLYAFDNNKTMKIIYSMYRAGEASVHRAYCERATEPYSLGGGDTIYPGSRPAGVTTRCPRMVTECLLTRSMLKVIYKGSFKSFGALCADRICSDQHFVENCIENFPSV